MAQTLEKVAVSGKNTSLAHGVGRRKTSVARAWFRRGKGNVRVNTNDLKKYFDTKLDVQLAETPMRLVPISSNYDIKVTVRGGGKVSQADAVKLAISRGLLQIDETLRPVLRQHGLLTVDSRVKERKKPGQKGARRKFQFVKR
ncbi:30S ribosomal protein S9 [Candidatus Dependentiae bacterium]|nr:MAG: 30S ribosomal protein S9 [Candidatus Dependentiae bacterium]